MIGSPTVFHTAPPQPRSNARATWPYVLVGGPDASQNGLGLSMPAKFVLSSAMCSSPTVSYRLLPSPTVPYRPLPSSTRQSLVNGFRRPHPVRRRVHDLPAAAREVTPGKHVRMLREIRQLLERGLA